MAGCWTCLLPTGNLIRASRYRLREWHHPPFRCPPQKLRFHSLIPPSLTPFFLSIIEFHQGTLIYISSLLLICACPLTAPFSWTTRISSTIISCSFQIVSRMQSMIMNNHSKNQVGLRRPGLQCLLALNGPHDQVPNACPFLHLVARLALPPLCPPNPSQALVLGVPPPCAHFCFLPGLCAPSFLLFPFSIAHHLLLSKICLDIKSSP